MPLTTVTVSIQSYQITGAALPGGLVTFELTALDVDGGMIAPERTMVTLDATGAGTIALWPNARGTQGTQYRVTFFDSNGSMQWAGTALVPASACSLHNIIDLAPPTGLTTTIAAIIPAVVPTAGQIMVGNAGGTAYGVIAVSGDASLSSTGALTVTKTGGVAFGGAATKNVGTTAGTVAAGDDARLSDARTPVAHKASHATGGTDALTTADIADTLDHRYVTDAQRTVIASTSGTNTGDQNLSGLVPKTTTVNGQPLSANVALAKADVGLGSVDNTSDVNKPVSTAQAAADSNTLSNAKSYTDGQVAGLTSLPVRINQNVVTADFTVPAGHNALSAGPITVADGVTVTVTDHCTWSIQ